MKNGCSFRNQIGKEPTGIAVVTTSICKGIVLFAMAMKIEADIDSTLFTEVSYSLFNFIYLRMEYFAWLSPSPIQIHTTCVTSEVTIDNPVYIDHGIDLNSYILKKPPVLWGIN